MLLETCGCGFDPGRFHADPARFSHPCAKHKDIPTLIPHDSWARLVAKTAKVEVVVQETPAPKTVKKTVADKLSIDDKPV